MDILRPGGGKYLFAQPDLLDEGQMVQAQTREQASKTRPSIPRETEAQVLYRSRRRCAICFGLNRDASEKRGQIAHLDHDRSNNNIKNLAFLCLDHHDQYDSRTSQSKGFRRTEVQYYRADLEEALRASFSAPLQLYRDDPSIREWEGIYRCESGNASAELRIVRSSPDCYWIFGLAFWGIQTSEVPHDGILDAAAMLKGDCLVLKEQDYELSMALTNLGLTATEKPLAASLFGMNVSFEGQYRRVPTGGEALPQPEMRPFESEFWPEEGIPVFEAKCDRLVLRARPNFDAPMIGYLSVVQDSRILFSSFRYHTLRPGRVVVHEKCTLTGRNLGQTCYVSSANYYSDGGELITLKLEANDQLEYLQYRAEGSSFIRWQGLVLDVEDSPWLGSNRPLELVVEPVTEAWIQVASESDLASGWTLVEDGAISEINREF